MKYHIQFIMIKRIIIILIIFFPINIYALDKVTLAKCIDGDTARFLLNNEEIKVRFIGIDTPELNKDEYATEASNYTCNKLKNANKIELEYDINKIDKYGRTLAYIFVDDKLLEEQLLKNGLGKVKYINKKYKYYDKLVDAENKAIENKKGIYSNEEIRDNDNQNIESRIILYAKKLFSNILREIFN